MTKTDSKRYYSLLLKGLLLVNNGTGHAQSQLAVPKDFGSPVLQPEGDGAGS